MADQRINLTSSRNIGLDAARGIHPDMTPVHLVGFNRTVGTAFETIFNDSGGFNRVNSDGAGATGNFGGGASSVWRQSIPQFCTDIHPVWYGYLTRRNGNGSGERSVYKSCSKHGSCIYVWGNHSLHRFTFLGKTHYTFVI